MLGSPNYGFHKNPRFSVNHIADYLCTTNAAQREGVIRSAKFPRKSSVIAYSQSKRIIGDFLSKNSEDLSSFDDNIRRLETRFRNEPDGWTRDEIKHNLDALNAFKEMFESTKKKRHSFVIGPTDIVMNVNGVRINTRLDVSITETVSGDITYSGGGVLLIAGTEQGRKNIDERQKTVAGIVYWSLEGKNIEPLPRLCLSIDVFGGSTTKASASIDRFRSNVQSSCREVAARWNDIEPPTGYDGPDWR